MHKIIRLFRILFENLFINYKKYDKDFKLETNDILVSFNIRADHPRDNKTNWVYRRNSIVEFIKDRKPGIICMQEVHRHMFMWLYKRLFNTYNFIEISRGEVDKSILKTFNWFKDALVIWYDKNEYILLDYKVINATGGKALWCKLKSKSGIVYNIIDTHYSVDNQTNRQNTTNAVNMFISENNLTNVYFAGDFNSGCHSSELKSINLLYRIPLDEETQRTFNHFDDTWAIIDFIFSDRKMDYEICTKDYGVPYISDHYPIIINL